MGARLNLVQIAWFPIHTALPSLLLIAPIVSASPLPQESLEILFKLLPCREKEEREVAGTTVRGQSRSAYETKWGEILLLPFSDFLQLESCVLPVASTEQQKLHCMQHPASQAKVGEMWYELPSCNNMQHFPRAAGWRFLSVLFCFVTSAIIILASFTMIENPLGDWQCKHPQRARIAGQSAFVFGFYAPLQREERTTKTTKK